MRWNWKVEVIKALVYMLSQEIIIKKVKKKNTIKIVQKSQKMELHTLLELGTSFCSVFILWFILSLLF